MQPQIKAIETVYKGFRFRSRLEARWAVFFDQFGLRWEYEREGYDLDGVRYLPDFWLPELRMHVEVKPGPRNIAEMPAIYMAGRMGLNTKNGATDCYRPFDTFGDPESDFTSVCPYLLNHNGFRFYYTGPFRMGTGNHYGVHGDADDGMGMEAECLARALTGIRRADVFSRFLKIEKHSAP